MTPDQMDDVIETYAKIANAAEKALDDDKNLIDEQDRWLPTPDTYDFNWLEVSADKTYLRGSAKVYTMQTGGSSEWMEFSIPLDTLAKYL